MPSSDRLFLSARAGRAFILKHDRLFTVRFDDPVHRQAMEVEFLNFLRLYTDVEERDIKAADLSDLPSTLRQGWQQVHCVEAIAALMDAELAPPLRRDLAELAERFLANDAVRQFAASVFLNVPPPPDADVSGAAALLRESHPDRNDSPVRVLTLLRVITEQTPRIQALRDSLRRFIAQLPDRPLRDIAEAFVDEYHVIAGIVEASRTGGIDGLLESISIALLSLDPRIRQSIEIWLDSIGFTRKRRPKNEIPTITLTEQMSLQPTLSLYFGGSGVAVGNSISSMMESLDEDERHFIEPFFIDTQEPAIADHARSRHYYYNDLGVFFSPLFREFTSHRFPKNLGVAPVMNSANGAGSTRIFGSASLVANRDDFLLTIEQAARRLRAQTNRQSLQVFLTASTCGGTGAGMIIDAAALVRHFFRERGESPQIFLFLIGPTVFIDDPMITLREDQRNRMRASTYALLKELHHFAQGHPFRSGYRLRDSVVEISNGRDDDRLFDWVYYVDGQQESQGPTRGLREIVWTIAEAQLHLSVTEVGRKVSESLPNQREERTRDYALHFVHPDHRGRLSENVFHQLQLSSRKSFMSSLSVCNVRFPAGEIKKWFCAGWVRAALQQLLDGRPVADEATTVQAEMLLHDVGLTPEQLRSGISLDFSRSTDIPPTPRLGLFLRDLPKAASMFLEDARQVVEGMKTEAVSGVDALTGTGTIWEDRFAESRSGAERLWGLVFRCGLRLSDRSLVEMAKLLRDHAEKMRISSRAVQLEVSIEKAQSLLDNVGWRPNSLFSLLKLRRTAKVLVAELATLRRQLVEVSDANRQDAITRRTCLEVAEALTRWRREVLGPVILSAENALARAENELEQAHRKLATQQGVNARGQWVSGTTVQLADEDLLSSLSKSIEDVSVEHLVLRKLYEDGISLERVHLNMQTFAAFDSQSIVAILFANVEESMRDRLSFLDRGWKLPDAWHLLLATGAAFLDKGSEPLAMFSRAALGLPLQSYLLAPSDVSLPDPFGRGLGRMNRLASSDPLQLGVVTFVYGIPPNALEGIGELFEQYSMHVGDSGRAVRDDRYPLHVFRDAAETFDEPYSPLALLLNEDVRHSLVEAARMLWGRDIRLDVRDVSIVSPAQLDDWNLYVELTAKVLRYLAQFPVEADRLFAEGRFPDLEQLYERWRSRVAAREGPEHLS